MDNEPIKEELLTEKQRRTLRFLKFYERLVTEFAEKNNMEYWGELEDYLQKAVHDLDSPEAHAVYNFFLRYINEVDAEINEDIKKELYGEAAEKIIRATVKHTDLITYPLDKPNSKIWNLLPMDGGQASLQINTSKRGSDQEAIIFCYINLNNLDPKLKITKQLTPFDKRVYIAVASLFNGKNEYMTATQIYRQMGNTSTPRTTALRKINDSLTKMDAARIFVDNSREVQAQKHAKKFTYDAPLLPFERVTAEVNGKLTESAIRLLREPPLITFAKQRKQMTAFSLELLRSPINKTDINLMIDDYLIGRISQIKNAKRKASNKIVFSTVYENCKISGKKQKLRAREKIKRYLDHYKKTGFIKAYEEDKDGVTIIL